MARPAKPNSAHRLGKPLHVLLQELLVLFGNVGEAHSDTESAEKNWEKGLQMLAELTAGRL